jgi:hypothetical protein
MSMGCGDGNIRAGSRESGQMHMPFEWNKVRRVRISSLRSETIDPCVGFTCLAMSVEGHDISRGGRAGYKGVRAR